MGLKKIIDFLNKDISKLFKEEYQVWGFEIKDGLKEAKKVYADGRVVSYNLPIFV